MTEKPRFRLVSMLALAVTLAIPAVPVHAEDPPSRDECKELLRAGESSPGKSVPGWIGLAECHQRLGNIDKAVEMARQARSAASTPEERVDASQALACALLDRSDGQAEAADLFKENMASSGGKRARAGYYLALRELHRDGEAAEVLRSLKDDAPKDGGEVLPCKIQNPALAQVWDEFVDGLGLDEPLRVGDEVTRPEIIHQVNAVIPEAARKHPGFSGQVVVEAIIDRQGRIQNARVLKGQPYGLSESAIASVKQWRFKPATHKGKPVKVYYLLTVNFKVTNN